MQGGKCEVLRRKLEAERDEARAERDRLREAAQEMLDYTSSWSDVRMHTIRNKIRAALEHTGSEVKHG